MEKKKNRSKQSKECTLVVEEGSSVLLKVGNLRESWEKGKAGGSWGY